MVDDKFGIHIDDGHHLISDFAIEMKEKSIELYRWQIEAITFFFEHNHKAIFEVTTGAGKTFVAIKIMKRIWEKDPYAKALIVVPKNVIMETGWYKELSDAGVPIQNIGIFYGHIKEYGPITITNMQNLDKIALQIFDFIIFDELHNYGTTRLLEYVEYPCKYKLGLTATVERMDNTHYKIFEMFDYNIFKYSPSEALADQVLNPFMFVNVGVVMDSDSYEQYEELTQALNMIFRAGGGFNRIMKGKSPIKLTMLSKMNDRKELVNNYRLKFEVAKEIVKKHKNDKVIIFNQFNKQTNKLYWELLDIGIKARVIHSEIPKETRDQTLIDFRNDKFNVLLTSKVLDEGYNLPKLDVAIIMAGDSSPKQTIQRMGRVLRKKDKTSYLYQIYCVQTVEEDYGDKRAELFEELSTDYREIIYREGDRLVLN
jgi:superfamily II DNA or RNA helicase